MSGQLPFEDLDEKWYIEHYSDVAEAISSGKENLLGPITPFTAKRKDDAQIGSHLIINGISPIIPKSPGK